VDSTVQASRETIDLSAELTGSLEREDDALLLFLSGDAEKARRDLETERRRGLSALQRLGARLRDRETAEQELAARLSDEINRYRKAGDDLVVGDRHHDALEQYHRQVNPLLRQAVATCNELREVNFSAMQEAGFRARDEASRGTRIVSLIAIVAILIGAIVAVWLARSVLGPVRDLTASVEAIRQSDFDCRIIPSTHDELGELAFGFNRMAEALAEYRRSSLGEVLAAKTTLEATLNALPDAVLVFAPDGSLASLNPRAEAIFAAQKTGRARRLGDLSLTKQHRDAVRLALAGRPVPAQPPNFQETLNVALNGHVRRFLLTAVPIPNFTPQRFGAVAVLNDVTEFARLDELRSELIGIASHELKSPLTTLRMNLLMLQEKTAGITTRQRLLLSAAVQGCEELGRTIEELLDVTRIEAGQLRLNIAPVDLEAVFAAAQHALQPRFDDAGIRLIVTSDARMAVILGDAARLGSVFSNVLSNALKYTPTGGTVTMRLSSGQHSKESTDTHFQATVTDQGPGVPVEFRERIFDKFFRVEHQLGKLNECVRGSGIGLYLCREIIKAHGGTISCAPGDRGIGTRISISLPAGL
jgi:NtrC-family two-component system sensor histidine kinase KinB